jgi:hypothetical protein
MQNKKAIALLFLSCIIIKSNLAQVQDLKKLSPNNKKDRTAIINATRVLVKNELYLDFGYKCEPKFYVEQIKVYKNYAWFLFGILDEKGVKIPNLDLWDNNMNKNSSCLSSFHFSSRTYHLSVSICRDIYRIILIDFSNN